MADDIFYSRGSYIAYASPWCAIKNKALVVGQDLVDSITLYPSTFPGNVEIRAKAPWANPWSYGCGVYGYHHIAFGNYDGGFPNDAVEPRQVRNLKALEVDFAISFTKVAGDYNLLHEFYLTTKAGAHKDKVVEIGFFLHASPTAVTFAKTGSALGPYTDPSGRQWSIFQEKKFVMLFPADGQDVGAGTLDMKHVLDVLVTKGVITGEEWFNGAAIGIEPVQGDSKVDIGRWTVRLA